MLLYYHANPGHRGSNAAGSTRSAFAMWAPNVSFAHVFGRAHAAPALPGVGRDKIDLIPHGIPCIPTAPRSKDRLWVEGQRVLLTFGLLSRDKGIEYLRLVPRAKSLAAIALRRDDGRLSRRPPRATRERKPRSGIDVVLLAGSSENAVARPGVQRGRNAALGRHDPAALQNRGPSRTFASLCRALG